MKKVIVSLFIFIFLMFGYTADSAISNTQKCGCCGKGEYREQNGSWILYGCLCASPGSSLVPMCPYCGNCLNRHCTCSNQTDPGDQGGQEDQGGQTGHVCSFTATCSMTHCNIKVCSCGIHQNGATCGGGCSYVTCNHCSGRYCSRCNNHSCSCNYSKTCSKVHCFSKICSMCGKHQSGSCGGDHVFSSSRCGQAHCGDIICSVSGCTVHQSGNCGGDHIEGSWVEENSGRHKLTCTVNGCNVGIKYHTPAWSAPNSNHTSTCRQCTISYTHTPSWGGYQTSGGSHVSHCTVSVGGSRCAATLSHSPSWSGYFKADGGGESSGAEHIRRCTICGITSNGHWFGSSDTWYKLDGQSHRRTCSTCSLTQTLAHNFSGRESISDDIENHYKVCYTCTDDTGGNYRVLERHVDQDKNGRGDGICDLCYMELWRVNISNLRPTNQDITVKVEMFSDYNDKIELPTKMIDLYGNEIVESDGVYTISENTDSESGRYYIFRFETPDRDVKVEITNISKDIYGKIYMTPDTATKGTVTLKLVTSDEGIDKTIDLKFENESWINTPYNSTKDVYELTREVANNGEYTFYARDSLGNEKEFTVHVNNIVSGFGSVTTTFDAFPNGYIFTDILVNVSQAWVPNDAVINFLEGSIYKVDGESTRLISEDIVNKLQITDELGNAVTSSILHSGIYYVRVAIGGPNVFTDEGTYMVEIKNTMVNREDDTLITLIGKNRIEVVVQSLNDLT